MKKMFLFACLVLIPALFLFGCSTTTGTSTTTTTNATTTTTNLAPGAASISGTITLPGLAGVLGIYATTDPDFDPASPDWIEEEVLVSASDGSYTYSLPISSSGTYYVCAVLFVDSTGTHGDPTTGDRAGQFSNGAMPTSWGQTPDGPPEPIVVSTTAVTGKDFELLVTWQN